MSETVYEAGDLLEAVKGESVVRGRLIAGAATSGVGGYRYIGGSGSLDEIYLKRGWTITVIEKAKPPVVLPTERGFYLSAESKLWTRENFGAWRDDHDETRTDNDARAAAPFTKLEPVAETAKKVLDRLDVVGMHATRGRDSDNRVIYDENWDAIAAEFGVSS